VGWRAFCLALTTIALLTLALAACQEGDPQAPPTIDLARQRPALSLFGAQASDNVRAVAAGDVNGDGHQDIIVGAFNADGPQDSRPDCGETYVIFGPADRGQTIDLAEGQQDVTIFGADSGDSSGFAVATGDVNGDGIDDVLVGALLADGPGNERPNAGEAYVIFGSPALAPTVDIAPGEQDLTLFGAEEQDRLGASLASGDANGDGLDDIILGTERGDGPDNAREDSGDVYIVLGSISLSQTVDIALGDHSAAVFGAQEGDAFGVQVAAADWDGNGQADVLAAARAADGPDGMREDAGQAYVIPIGPRLK